MDGLRFLKIIYRNGYTEMDIQKSVYRILYIDLIHFLERCKGRNHLDLLIVGILYIVYLTRLDVDEITFAQSVADTIDDDIDLAL